MTTNQCVRALYEEIRSEQGRILNPGSIAGGKPQGDKR